MTLGEKRVRGVYRACSRVLRRSDDIHNVQQEGFARKDRSLCVPMNIEA